MVAVNYQAVFFDFDGVILDSVHVKTKAFAKMFRSCGAEIEKKVIDYHLENGGVSRFDKFRYYYKNFLDKMITDEEVLKLSSKFSDMVVHDVIDSEFIEGAYETLTALHRSETPMYIVSGTPHDEIQVIVKQKGLSHFFIGVYGSPRKKWEITKEILSDKAYDASQCLFIGDAMSDYNAALKTGMQFLGIAPKNKISPFPESTKVLNKVEL